MILISTFRECLVSSIGISCFETIDMREPLIFYAYIKILETVFQDIKSKITDMETVDVNYLTE